MPILLRQGFEEFRAIQRIEKPLSASPRRFLMDKFCSYYQAHIRKPDVLFVVATLKTFEHLCFDRALDPAESRFEFFVPAAGEEQFLRVMHAFEQEGIVQNLKKLPNRLIDGEL